MAEDTRARIRPTGATASLGRTGFPHIVSATGGEIDIVTGASQPGFNPLDLLYASLSACLAMSARIAAHQSGVLDRIEAIAVEVSGKKAEHGASRIESLRATFKIAGDLDAAERALLIHQAEEICTVSNTLKASPGFDLRIGEE